MVTKWLWYDYDNNGNMVDWYDYDNNLSFWGLSTILNPCDVPPFFIQLFHCELWPIKAKNSEIHHQFRMQENCLSVGFLGFLPPINWCSSPPTAQHSSTFPPCDSAGALFHPSPGAWYPVGPHSSVHPERIGWEFERKFHLDATSCIWQLDEKIGVRFGFRSRSD